MFFEVILNWGGGGKIGTFGYKRQGHMNAKKKQSPKETGRQCENGLKGKACCKALLESLLT